MKILVTGGAGYIGAIICSALIDANYTPIILDSLVTGRHEFVKDRIFYNGDIANHELLSKIFEEHSDIECCIHCAARVIIPESIKNPNLYYIENVVKSISLFNSLKLLGLKKIIFSSSASVYKAIDISMVTEESEVLPLNPYSRTKLFMEMALEDFCNAGYFRGIVLRYFNPIGADIKMRSGSFIPQPSHILGKLVNTALGIEPAFYINGIDWPTRDGSAMRDYINIWDLAQAHISTLKKFDKVFKNQKDNYCIINLGSGNGVTVKEFVKAFINVYGKNIIVKSANRRWGDVAGAYANCDKANKLLDWSTKYTIEDGIESAIRWASKERINILGY